MKTKNIEKITKKYAKKNEENSVTQKRIENRKKMSKKYASLERL